MKFKEFEAKLRETVDFWLTNWVENNAAEPELYPMEMSEGDWWEQFLAEEF